MFLNATEMNFNIFMLKLCSQLGQQRMPLDVVKYLLGRGGKITLFGNQCAREEIKKNIFYMLYIL